MKILITYATTTGNTEYVARVISYALKSHEVEVKNVRDVSPNDFADYDLLIFGTPTWGNGNMHKDWGEFAEKLLGKSLKGKNVALFGLGDSLMFSKQFADGLKELYDLCIKEGANVVGRWETEGYKFESSKAVISGEFCGLVIDQENEGELTVNRVNEWVRKVLLEIGERTDT